MASRCAALAVFAPPPSTPPCTCAPRAGARAAVRPRPAPNRPRASGQAALPRVVRGARQVRGGAGAGSLGRRLGAPDTRPLCGGGGARPACARAAPLSCTDVTAPCFAQGGHRMKQTLVAPGTHAVRGLQSPTSWPPPPSPPGAALDSWVAAGGLGCGDALGASPTALLPLRSWVPVPPSARGPPPSCIRSGYYCLHRFASLLRPLHRCRPPSGAPRHEGLWLEGERVDGGRRALTHGFYSAARRQARRALRAACAPH
jgi:hypothetical protein